MKRKVLVIGLGRFGNRLSRSLYQLGYEVLAMDLDEAKVQAISQSVSHSIQGDATKESTLQEVDAAGFDIAVVAIGTDMKSSVLATILLKKLGVQYIVARANDELHGRILEKIGAETVINPEENTGARLAHWIHQRNVTEYITITESFGVAKIYAPEYFIGKELKALGFGRDDKKAVAVLIIKRAEEVTINPKLTDTVQQEDILVVSGNDDALEQILDRAQKIFDKEQEEKGQTAK